MWQKTMVYFGLVEDSLDEKDDFDEEEEHLAAHRELEESYKERPNVRLHPPVPPLFPLHAKSLYR